MISPWHSFVRYVRTRGRHSATTNSNQPKDPFYGLSDDDPTLPHFQHQRPTGIHTFIRKAHRSRPQQGIIVRTELSTHRTLASVDDTYHEQLKRTYLESYHAKNSVSSRTHAASDDDACSAPRAYSGVPVDFCTQAYSHDQADSTAHISHSSHEALNEHCTVSRAV